MSTPFNSQGTATRVAPDRKVVSSSVDIAEAFNDNFTSVFSSDTEESRRQLTPIDEPVLEEISLSLSEVVAALLSLHVSKASGPDGISARLLKKQLNRSHYLQLYSTTSHLKMASSQARGNLLISCQYTRKVIKIMSRTIGQYPC